MIKIFLACMFGMFVVYGAGSMESTEDSAFLPQKAEYKIIEIVVNNEVLQASDGAIFGIDGTRIYGNTGCNNYFTDFNRKDNTTIEISTNGGSTKMMCDKKTNKFEHIFLQNLVGKFNVANSGDKLSISNDKMQVMLQRAN